MLACSSEETLTEEGDISGSTDPMRFTTAKESQQTRTRATDNTLHSGFMVSCYKHYAETNQQTVMPQYEVRYHVTGDAWNGRTYSSWTYDDVNGQYLRYWDYSAYPYRFHAIAPYPANASGFVLSDKSLTIPVPYYAQTCHNGMVTPSDNTAEPHLVSQVQRNTDGKDYDAFIMSYDKSELNNSSTMKNRDVWMPFHHLNMKTRFAVYHTTQWLTANHTYIQNLTVSVVSTPFATRATGYEATVSDRSDPGSPEPDANGIGNTWYRSTGNSGFTGVGTVTPSGNEPHEIFRFDGGIEVPGNDLRDCQTRKTAYFLQCPAGIMQIPQENVRMVVSFDIMNADGTLKKAFSNVPVRLELDDNPGTYQYTFNWQSGYIHTYYLVIGEIDEKLEITFTATLTPWEDIYGSLSTDLEQ